MDSPILLEKDSFKFEVSCTNTNTNTFGLSNGTTTKDRSFKISSFKDI